jgi:hypothetical protein
MGSFGKKLLRSMASIVVLTPAAFVAVSVATPGIASARCAGVGNEIRSTLIVGGQEWVAERPDSGTCNGNNTYNGHFAAKIAGVRASVWIQNGGVWTAHLGSGYNMLNNNYSYSDNNSNSLMALCVDDGVTTVCGWGTTWASDAYPFFTIPASGVNSGF